MDVLYLQNVTNTLLQFALHAYIFRIHTQIRFRVIFKQKHRIVLNVHGG